MMRRVFCAASFFIFIYLLACACMQAWLTAADPDSVEEHRMFFFICLAASGLMYMLFGVLLRPHSVLHFVLCSVALPLLPATAVVQAQGYRPGWTLAMVASAAYLLWRVWVAVNRK